MWKLVPLETRSLIALAWKSLADATINLKQAHHSWIKATPLRLIWEKPINLRDTSNLHPRTVIRPYHLTYHGALSNMNTLPSGNGGSSLAGDPCSCIISNTGADNNTTNNVHGNSNTNFANVSNNYNNTINVGVSEESSRIQERLSPLEAHARNEDVRNRRMDGVEDWVLQENEFESWRESQDTSMNPTILCYGDQGVGKTYIRYGGIFWGG